MIRKVFMAATMLVAAVTSASAQNNGLAGINDATKMVTSYFDPGTKLVYAIGAVVGLIGGIKTYNKFSSGDPDTAKTAGSARAYFSLSPRRYFVPFSCNPFQARIMEYSINKGIGRSVEFRGLKAQYLFIFAGGLLAVFVLFVVLYMAGVNQWVCIGFGIVAASALVTVTFRLNAKYGEHGLMKLAAARQRPRYLINRKAPFHLLPSQRKEVRR